MSQAETVAIREALRTLGPLREFTDAELDVLIAVAPVRRFAKGEWLCREGSTGASCFVLVTGEVEIRKAFGNAERVLATLRGGAVVGQMALVDHGKRSASAMAATPTVSLELARDVFERLLHSESALALRFQEQVAVAGIRQLRMATERLVLLRSEAARVASEAQAAQQASAHAERARDSLVGLQAATGEWAVSLDEVEVVPDATRTRTR